MPLEPRLLKQSWKGLDKYRNIFEEAKEKQKVNFDKHHMAPLHHSSMGEWIYVKNMY